jgi:hypothetical protein
MAPSLAVSAASGMPSSRNSRCCSASRARRIPRLRWVSATDTQVTPGTGSVAPPGIVMAKSNEPVTPTTVSSTGSTANQNRSRSTHDAKSSRSVSL